MYILQYTSNVKNTQSSPYIKFKNTAGQTSTSYIFPKTYIELEFDQLTISSVTP